MNRVKHPLAVSIADRLRVSFQANRFKDVLPGERELAAAYNVGRGTIRAALLRLEREGWLTPAGVRSPRRIIRNAPGAECSPPSPSAKRRVSAGVLTSVPVDSMPQGILAELHHLRPLLERHGLDFHLHKLPEGRGKNRENQLSRLVAKNSHDCWILYRASRETQHWFRRQHLPCLVRGTSYPSAALPCMDTDWRATARHAAAHLWRKGHRTVCLCVPEEPLKGHQLIQKYLCDFKGKGWNPVIVPFSPDAVSTFDNLERVFARHPGITAFITTRGEQIVSFLSWTVKHALSIPDDISLVTLHDEPMLDHLHPAIAGYRTNAEKSARRLARMVRSVLCSKNTLSALVIPDFIPGQSISTRTGAGHEEA